MLPKATTLVFLGRSGSGKDTQIDFLTRKPDFKNAVKIEVGKLFRNLSAKNSLFGRKTKDVLGEGGLFPWWLAISLWISELDLKLKGDETLIVDGTRRLEEAELLNEVLEFIGRPKTVAILLDISEEESLRRLLSRKRGDDTEASIKKRLSWFKTNVVPAIEYYRKNGRLIEVRGEGSREKIFEELWTKLNDYFKK